MNKKQKWTILSLGGSLVVPDKIDPHTKNFGVGIDRNFLKKFKKFILKWLKRDKKFIIFVGGGKIARYYQKTAEELGVLNTGSLDWIGIFATWLNASLVQSLFKNKVYQEIIKDPTEKIKTNKKIIVSGGWKPGWSTDYDAVKIAKVYHTNTIINLSDIDYVYDKDPDKFKDAKPLKQISFSEFFKIGGRKWKAGLNLPFDPIASKLAQKYNFRVIILKGTDLKNLDNLFQGKNFKGTIIKGK